LKNAGFIKRKGVFGLYMGLKNPEILILIDKL